MIQKTGYSVILTVILTLLIPFTAVSEETRKTQRTIATQGTADIKVKPNMAFLLVKVETKAEIAKDARDKNADITKNVRKALLSEKLKLTKKDIETSSFNLSPRMTWNEKKRKNEMWGYQVTHLLKITVTNLDLVGNILDASINAGANGVNNVLFTLSESEKKNIKAKALQIASKNAKEKALILTKSLGVSLGEVLSIVEGNTSFTPFREARGFVMKSEMMAESAATEITPGEVNVTASVSLVFELR